MKKLLTLTLLSTLLVCLAVPNALASPEVYEESQPEDYEESQEETDMSFDRMEGKVKFCRCRGNFKVGLYLYQTGYPPQLIASGLSKKQCLEAIRYPPCV